jgi:hypothetical protein
MNISAHLLLSMRPRHEPLEASGDRLQRLTGFARYWFYKKPTAHEPAEIVFRCKGTLHLFSHSQAKAETGEMSMKGYNGPQFQKSVTTITWHSTT